MSWIFGSATRKGAMHGESEVCQDFVHCELLPGGQLLALLADGAGSAKLGDEGAKVACLAFRDHFVAAIAEQYEVGRSGLLGAFGKTIESVEVRASELKANPSDLSSTLIAAIVTDKDAYILQIGDGAAVMRMNDEYVVATWPAETEFVNTTHFVTSPNAIDLVQIRRIAGRIDELQIFSDGLQYLVLDFKAKGPHQKFFHSVSEQLLGDSEGESSNFNAWLEALLAAPQVTQRTDDDTSIVCAKRLQGEPCR